LTGSQCFSFPPNDPERGGGPNYLKRFGKTALRYSFLMVLWLQVPEGVDWAALIKNAMVTTFMLAFKLYQDDQNSPSLLHKLLSRWLKGALHEAHVMWPAVCRSVLEMDVPPAVLGRLLQLPTPAMKKKKLHHSSHIRLIR